MYSNFDTELVCLSCGQSYPVSNGIPVMFNDKKRTEVLTSSACYEKQLQLAKEKKENAESLNQVEFSQLTEKEKLFDALMGEILIWEKWKSLSNGTPVYDKEEIERYLENGRQGGGKQKFLDRIKKDNMPIEGKRILDIGSGWFVLLEYLINEGCEVVAQDVLPESLLLLKKRGASFCICCDARVLPFEENAFDIASCFEVIHHIWPIGQPIRELLRVTSSNIHIDEPNSYAVTRAARLLPKPILKKITQIFADADSHSPHEKSINPYEFKKIVKNNSGKIKQFRFTKTSWISGDKNRVMKMISAMISLIIHILPLVSSHFYSVIKKNT